MELLWQAPPENPATFNGLNFVMSRNLASMLAKVNATNGVYSERAMSFMTAPSPSNLATLKNHGTSDPIFSNDDTTAWYEALRAANGGDASNFARMFRVMGMNHCSGGPATDQFDMLTPLVNRVKRGQTPDSVPASVRGAGNSGGVNAAAARRVIVVDWRRRPLH